MSSEIVEVERVETGVLELRAQLFRGLADPSRLSILQFLRAGPLSVGEIVRATGLSQPNASNHLRCLTECGLVVGEQRGRFVFYRHSDVRIAQLLGIADQLLMDAAEGVQTCENYRRERST